MAGETNAVQISRRRWPRRVVVIAAVLLMISAGAAGAVVWNYDPLEAGSVSGTPVNPGFRDTEDARGGRRTITYAHGAQLDVLFAIRNRGPWGVTITDITSREFGLYHVRGIRRGVLNRCCIETEPFRPFALAPGEERMIRLSGVLTGCENFSDGSLAGWDVYTVQYEVLRVERRTSMPVRGVIEIEIPRGYVCPVAAR